MATQETIDEADVRRRVDELVEAIHAMDLEGVMSFYAPDIVSFDIEPPLRHVGAAAKSKNWSGVFAMSRPRSAMRFTISPSSRPTPWHSGTASIA